MTTLCAMARIGGLWLLISFLLSVFEALNLGIVASEMQYFTEITHKEQLLDQGNPTLQPTEKDDRNDDMNEICSQHNSCYDCVGLFSEDEGCYWCPGTGKCEGMNQPFLCNGGEHKTTCTDSLYTIVFLTIFGVMFLLCCTVCYCKVKQREREGFSLMPEEIRAMIFRNSLADVNEQEWMCVICG